MTQQLRCFCRERGSCDCPGQCTEMRGKWFPTCYCIDDYIEIASQQFLCDCIIFPVTQSPAINSSYLTNTHDVLRRGAH